MKRRPMMDPESSFTATVPSGFDMPEASVPSDSFFFESRADEDFFAPLFCGALDGGDLRAPVGEEPEGRSVPGFHIL
eukprot:CAMPEP_0113298200 /NCGR_PEP_ID=MMETSP0010_2-20120614/745_1 /TAXON_ID=216773 ORGANISM="Corethron hystrix, Strain 308" /NCGR_SAMPLE_ID=MMETSP0010_2 /ASSEMBLY_ACC=CAM_ASM_000155 /LENGTH=76 /DNA_ID=CAMNT_0000151217 /DNA_START=552 /DNA_END=782 /DNA_ORIENTATION=- /assembly_acc=CAM_ASM_000155